MDIAGFPTVLRSDHAGEFVGEVVSWMNDELGDPTGDRVDLPPTIPGNR